MSFKEYLSEAKAMRAWGGKLKQVDKLLSWMYDKDILNKGEKNKKDSLFNQYYRYYNDGDFPRGLKDEQGYVLSKYSHAETIQTALEAKIEDFIKKVLAKYMDKIDRKDFRIDQGLADIETVIDVSARFDVHSLTKYWHKNVKDADTLAMIKELETKYDQLEAITKTANDAHKWENKYDNPQNTMMGSRKTVMTTAGIWTSEMETMWKVIQTEMIKITTKLKNIKSALEELKTLKALG